MLTTTSPRRRLLLQSTATLTLLLLVGFTVLMHATAGRSAGHDHPMAASAADVAHAGDATVDHVVTRTDDAHRASAAATTVLTAAGCDDGLCALLCSLMGMACALTTALFAWVLLRERSGGVLSLLARMLALAERVPHRVAKPRPPSLTALQISRV